MTNGKRDYKREYDLYHKRKKQKVNRATRNAAHRDVEKRIGHKTSMDVDHKKPLSRNGTNSSSNLRLTSASANRSFSRNRDGSLKSQRSKSGK